MTPEIKARLDEIRKRCKLSKQHFSYQLINHAPDDIPFLLALVDRQQRALKEAESWMDALSLIDQRHALTEIQAILNGSDDSKQNS